MQKVGEIEKFSGKRIAYVCPKCGETFTIVPFRCSWCGYITVERSGIKRNQAPTRKKKRKGRR